MAKLRSIGASGLLAAASVVATYLFFEFVVAPTLHEQFGWFGVAYFVRDVQHTMPTNLARRPTNQDGIRSRRQPAEFDADGFNIIFLGDSFTYGWKLRFEQSFPHRVERSLRKRFPRRNVKVANFGWISSSPMLSSWRLRDIGANYEPDLVVLCLDMTDFHDDLKYARVITKAIVYQRMSRFPLAVTVLHRFAPDAYRRLLNRTTGVEVPADRFFAVNLPLRETRSELRPLQNNVQRIYEQSQELGARFVLVVLPRHFQYASNESPNSWESGFYDSAGPWVLEPFRFFEELAAEVDYPIHSLLDAFRETDVFPTTFDADPHWNAAGAGVAAEAITEILSEYVGAAGDASGTRLDQSRGSS